MGKKRGATADENTGEDMDRADRMDPFNKICPSCLTPNRESAHVCRTCFTPLSAHAAIDPILSIGARADTFGKAARAPRKPIMLLGMWMIFGPMALIFGVLLILDLYQLATAPTFPAFVALIPLALFLFISAGLVIKTTVNFLRAPAPDEGGFPVVEDEEKIEDEEEGEPEEPAAHGEAPDEDAASGRRDEEDTKSSGADAARERDDRETKSPDEEAPAERDEKSVKSPHEDALRLFHNQMGEARKPRRKGGAT